LPAFAGLERPLAIQRPDWTSKGDLVAVDHRIPGPTTQFELTARGRTWLGPTWSSPTSLTPSRARATQASSGAFADVFEWTYRVGTARVTRVSVLLRGKSLALIGQQDEGMGAVSEVRLAIAPGVLAQVSDDRRSVSLAWGSRRPEVRVIPLAFAPTAPVSRGSITVEENQVVIRQAAEGKRCWVPILLAWGRAPVTWRPLTVSRDSKACRDDVATASRVAWGMGESGLLVYRSLGSAALRVFLGHQTRARFLVGEFTPTGEVKPIVKLD
jgi:hypothetical protein